MENKLANKPFYLLTDDEKKERWKKAIADKCQRAYERKYYSVPLDAHNWDAINNIEIYRERWEGWKDGYQAAEAEAGVVIDRLVEQIDKMYDHDTSGLVEALALAAEYKQQGRRVMISDEELAAMDNHLIVSEAMTRKLIAALREERARSERLRDALRYYTISNDYGAKARQALANDEGKQYGAS